MAEEYQKKDDQKPEGKPKGFPEIHYSRPADANPVRTLLDSGKTVEDLTRANKDQTDWNRNSEDK